MPAFTRTAKLLVPALLLLLAAVTGVQTAQAAQGVVIQQIVVLKRSA